VLNEFSFGENSGWVELLNQGPEPIKLGDYLLATKTTGGNQAFPLDSSTTVQPGHHGVIRIPRQRDPGPERPIDDAADRRQIVSFPGFDPEGGIVALVRTATSSVGWEGEQRDEVVQDFAFYGPQVPGRSYGRWHGGFSRMVPTPGKKNVVD
jgi:hypothetical protein